MALTAELVIPDELLPTRTVVVRGDPVTMQTECRNVAVVQIGRCVDVVAVGRDVEVLDVAHEDPEVIG